MVPTVVRGRTFWTRIVLVLRIRPYLRLLVISASLGAASAVAQDERDGLLAEVTEPSPAKPGIAYYEELTKKSPDEAANHQLLAAAYGRQGRVDRARGDGLARRLWGMQHGPVAGEFAEGLRKAQSRKRSHFLLARQLRVPRQKLPAHETPRQHDAHGARTHRVLLQQTRQRGRGGQPWSRVGIGRTRLFVERTHTLLPRAGQRHAHDLVRAKPDMPSRGPTRPHGSTPADWSARHAPGPGPPRASTAFPCCGRPP